MLVYNGKEQAEMSELPISSEENMQNVSLVEKKTEEKEATYAGNHSVTLKETTLKAADDDTTMMTSTGLNNIDTSVNRLDEEMAEEILELKLKVSTLISNIRDTKTLCDKYDNQNQYLQDYVGNLMKSGGMK